MASNENELKTNLPIPQRKLNEQETLRIEKMKERRKGKFSSHFFEVGKEGKASYLTKESLSDQDAELEHQSRLSEATGCAFAGHQVLVQSAVNLCRTGSVEEFVKKLNDVGLLLRELEPRDGVEAMLCSQIVVLQQKWMDLLSSAEAQKSNYHWANAFFNAASKVLTRSQNALMLLASYRRGGQQKVMVEHVNVAPGAQAAIGVFSNARGGSEERENSRGTL